MYFSREWLENKLLTLSSEEEKLWMKITFLSSAADLLPELCNELCDELREKAERDNMPSLLAYVLVSEAHREIPRSGPEEFRKKMDAAERIASEAPPSAYTAMVLQMRAFAYWAEGQRERALAMAYTARKQMLEEAGEALGWTDYQLAVFHTDLKDYEKALEYFDYSEKVAIAKEAVYQLARIRSGKAAIAIAQQRIEDAMRLNELAIEGYRSCGHHTAISRALNDLGVICFKQGDHAKAKQYLGEAMEIRRKSNYWPGLTTTQIELARIHIAEKNFSLASALLAEALDLSEQMGARQKVITCHSLLAHLHKLRGEFKDALDHLEKEHEVQRELSGEEASNRIKHLQQKHATEAADREAEIHRLKNVELKQAYDAIEDQNKSILDSINYARKIQSALLGSEAMVNRNLPENFILYKPKDIVSGDFWWCAEEGNKFCFAVADCTGHGVPGAFMSLLNINLLNRALNENPGATAAHLLGEVRKHLVASLNHDGQETARDGMDAVLCILHRDSGKLEFACANNALLLIRKGNLTVHGPDKFPVGLSHGDELLPFTHHVIQLEQNDCIYLSTDGFQDQFGGQKGKKFKQKRLRELLLNNSGSAMTQQLNLLERTFESWRGNLEQVDDVLLMGFRYMN